jgi:hypothetical protein
VSDRVTVTGGCHCNGVRFRAEVEQAPQLLRCNCSICAPTGYLHLIVPHQDFTLLSGKDELTSYRFGTGQAEHLFCRICGIKCFYQPRSHPGSWSVHFACLDDASAIDSEIIDFDGQNWEQAAGQLNQ